MWAGRRRTRLGAGDDVLGNGLYDAGHHEDALSVQEASGLFCGGLAHQQIIAQGNLAMSYEMLGRLEDALRV